MAVHWYDELTPREREVLAEAHTGATAAQIAARLFIEPSTVKSHLSSIYLKANACSRMGALATSVDPEKVDLTAFCLSPRQQDVVRRLLHGESNREIGKTLFVSPETVKDHLKRIYDALGVRSRYEVLAAVAGARTAQGHP